MTIRRYRTEDYAAVCHIYASSKLDEFRFEPHFKQFTLLSLDQDDRRHKEFKESTIYVYEHQGIGIIGYCAQYQHIIRSIYVLPEYRGQGLGTHMLEFLINKMTKPIHLYVAKSNQPAIRLYQKYSFVICNDYTADYHGQSATAVEMILPS